MQDTTNSRFAALFSEYPERAIWDNVILRLEDFAVAPTRGSIIPNWLLIVPKTDAINFAEVAGSVDIKPYALISRVADELSTAPENLIWFEHGADVRGSTVGCGVDHAHLHVLLSPGFTLDDFAVAAFEASGEEWISRTALCAYDGLDAQTSYYVFGNMERAFTVSNANFGSQFFRKLIARFAGRPAEWDYKEFGGESKVRETLAALNLDAAAA